MLKFAAFTALAASASANLIGEKAARRFRGHGVRVGEASPEATAEVDQIWHEQYLDHYTLTDKTTWKQRAYLNDKFWGGEGSPVFVYIGGEGPLTSSSLTDRMFMYELCEQHDCYMAGLEHRFYGESYPTDDMSTANLEKYLSSQQALADLANFVTELKADKGLGDDAKVISFGGSYPGNLAAWSRLKYPSVFHAAVASSAPVQAHAPFVEYAQVCDDALTAWGGDQCRESVEAAVNATQKYIDAGDWDGLGKVYNLCQAPENAMDVATLQMNLFGNVQGIVQYNEEGQPMQVSDICDIMAAGDDPLTQFADFTDQALGGECVDAAYDDYLDFLTNATFDGESSFRQWIFQSCNSFGYWQEVTSAPNSFQAFSALTTEQQQQQCDDVFGIKTEPATGFTNMYYGATDIDATRIVFPGGSGDPWHALGMNNDTAFANDDMQPVEMVMTAHCRDMYSSADDDPATVVWGHSVIADAVAGWLA